MPLFGRVAPGGAVGLRHRLVFPGGLLLLGRLVVEVELVVVLVRLRRLVLVVGHLVLVLDLLGRLLDVGHAGRGLAAGRRRVGGYVRLRHLGVRAGVLQLRLSHELGRRLGRGIRNGVAIRRRSLGAGALGRAERLILELLQLGIVGAVLALELQMLPDCLVENAHKPVPWGS